MRFGLRPPRGQHRVVLALVISLTACGASDAPQPPPDMSADPLVGAWTLVSWESTAEDGTVRQPYGPEAAGQIVYTADGRMSAQLMRPGREYSDQDTLTAAEVLGGFFSYYGTYTVDHENGVVTHQVEGALLPSWMGSRRPRAFTFAGPDRVTLSTAPDPGRTNGSISVLVWERAAGGRSDPDPRP